MKRFLINASCIFVFLLMLAGCRKGPDRDNENIIYVTHALLNMIEGDEVQVTASPTDQTFVWESSNPAVATVSSTGVVRAIKDGVTAIIVTSSGGLQRSIPVDVVTFIPVTGIELSESSLSLALRETFELEATSVPKRYNEKIPFNLTWRSSNSNIVSVDENGKVEALDFGDAVITASLIDRPSVKAEIQVSVPETAITEIQVSESSLKLLPGETATVTTTMLPTNYSVKDPSLVWTSSNESIVKVTDGRIEGISVGEATITVSLNSNPSVKTEIQVEVAINIINISKFTDAGSAGPNCVRQKISFVKDDKITVVGLNQSQIAAAYNRDFFNYNSDNGTLTFDGESGEYDVFYSSTYNYIWVCRVADVAPACYWIIGSGACVPPVWHSDFGSGGWSFDVITRLPYMRMLDNGKYQATIYLRTGFDIQVYAQRNWNVVVQPSSLTGDRTGIAVHSNGSDIVTEDGFVEGYYRLTLDMSDKVLNFEKLN